MANNYTQWSAALYVEDTTKEALQEFIDAEIAKLEDSEDGFYGGRIEVEDHGDLRFVWFCSEEGGVIEDTVAVATALMENFNTEHRFTISWAYTCSKPRLDEFGGGAVCLVKGQEPIWIDAMNAVNMKAENIYFKSNSSVPEKVRVRCIYVGTNASGEPDFDACIVEMTEEEIHAGFHYEVVGEYARRQAFEEPLVVMDENDAGGKRLLEFFHWASAPVINEGNEAVV